MRKGIYQYIVIFFICICACFSACGKEKIVVKSDRTLIFERIEAFEKSYNDGDWDSVMESFSTKTRNQVEASFGLLGGLIGGVSGFTFEIGDLFSLGIASMGEGDVLSIEIESVSVSKPTAVATGQMGYVNDTNTAMEYVYFELVQENGGWYIEAIQDEPIFLPEDKNETKTGYSIVETGEFLDGRAWIKYEKASANYWGFTDMAGKAVYTEKDDGQKFLNIGKGSGIIQTDKSLKLIDKNGAEKLTLEGKTELIYGDGCVWVYQDKSTITSIAHMYGAFDYNGNWFIPLTTSEESNLLNTVKYVGNGMLAEKSSRSTTNYTITNGKTGAEKRVICIENTWVNWDIQFENGMAYIQDKLRGGDNYITVTTFDEKGEAYTTRQEIDGNFILFSNGRTIQLDTPPKIYTDGKTVTEKEGYFEIVDYTKQTPKKALFDKYPSSMVENICFLGEFGLLQLYGVDKKHYFTVIDTNGNQLFEPVYRDDYQNYSSKLILYPDGNVLWKHTDGLKVVEKSGKITLIGEMGSIFNAGYRTTTPTQGYILKEDKNSYFSYCSVFGETIFSKVREKE